MPISVPRLGLLRAAVVFACLVIAGILASSARAADVGVNSDITWGIPAASVTQEIAATQQAGIPWVRATIDLSGAEYYGPQLNPGYLNSIDAAVRAARAAGENVLLELDRTPYWASADPAKYTDSNGPHWNPYYEYTTPQVYAQVASDVVKHYAAMGVHAYEVWNEPNNPSFWPSGADPTAYTALLKAAYPAIKAADPSATVLMGGLENEGSYAFLQGMYNAGARGSFDVANFHIYPSGDPTQCVNGSDGRPSENSFCLLDGLHAVMTANGDSSPVWVTELGWSTCTVGWCVTPQQQASYVTSAYQSLSTSRYSWVQKAFVYQLRDLYTASAPSTWGTALGMMSRDFVPKPSYYALAAAAAASPPSASPPTGAGGGAPSGGTPAPPTVAISAPTANRAVGTTFTTTAVASDPAGISKVSFSLDGNTPVSDSNAPYSVKLSTKYVAPGIHTVSATAYDTAGRTASTKVTVVTGTSTVRAAMAAIKPARVSLHVRTRGHHGRVLAAQGRVTTSRRTRARIVLFVQRRRRPSASLGARHRRDPIAVAAGAGAKSGWRTVRRVVLRLHGGRFAARLPISSGSWRVWVRFGAVDSPIRLLRVAVRSSRKR